MKFLSAVSLCFWIFPAVSLAQESLVGRYSGTFRLQAPQGAGVVPIAMTIEITNAANGKLQGKAARYTYGKVGTGCVGEYKLEGTYEGNKLEITSEAGGPTKECTLELRLVAEGNKLKGKMRLKGRTDESDTELSKER